MKPIALLAAVALVGGCGIDKEVYEAKVAELNKTKAAARPDAEGRRRGQAPLRRRPRPASTPRTWR